MTKKIELKINKNGPINVTGFDEITFCGESLETNDRVFLCRCGNTQNAPFCDGSHNRTDFDDTCEVTEQQAIRIWEGHTIKTHFNANLCMHARYCKGLGALRKLESEKADTDVARKIAEIVTQCPSGALSYEMLGSENTVEFTSTGKIDIIEGGEVRIQCEVEGDSLTPQKNQPANRLTLCRCGLSKNKPYCDASHSDKEGFK